jgi:deoxyribodipyrimidine photo-lyase
MLKPTVKRGLMLDFIPDEIFCPVKINPNRVFKLNDKPILNGDIVYLATRELRLHDNWAVQFGKELAELNRRKFRTVVIPEKIIYSKIQEKFLLDGLNKTGFEILNELPDNIGALIVDFNPIHPHPQPLPPQGGGEHIPIFEVDSHNIIPARFISDKQEFSAATLRRKIYANIAEFLTEYRDKSFKNPIITEFIQNRLDFYAELKNNPNNDVTSHLSPYLHFGFISSQRVALEVIKSRASRANKEAFLEELIVRKELADNFCLYGKSFTTLEGISNWAKETLNLHKNDIRNYLYTKNEFEHSKTHDEIWNKIQEGLIKEGRIHGYLRMYWAKKILEWSKSPEDALKTAIYLNDKHALDGNDSNGYVGILWSIGGLHDRAFADRLVTGKVRYMGTRKINFEKI